MVEALKPAYVAPLVAFLTHEQNTNTGGVYEVGSGWISKVRWQRTGGVGFPVTKALMPEDIAARWAEITNFTDGRATYPASTQEAFAAIQANFENKGSAISTKAASSGAVNVATAQNAVFASVDYSYTQRDVILYNLGLGAHRTDLDLVYESNDKFHAVPTFGVIPAFYYQMDNLPFMKYLPEFNPMMLVHGEQYLEIRKPLPTSGKVSISGKIIDILVINMMFILG